MKQFAQISPDTHEPVETTNNLVAIIGAVALGRIVEQGGKAQCHIKLLLRIKSISKIQN